MSEQPTFSLAIVRGAGAGRILSSARKRISIGAARDNDLVLEDPEASPRHCLVLIDNGRWRLHSLTEREVKVERRWAHPSNGKRGAVIRAASTEILLFPGVLDEDVVSQEVGQRREADDAAEIATSINLPKIQLEDQNEPTVAVKAMDASAPAEGEGFVEIATMPTIAGERPADDLRSAAQEALQQLRNEGGPVAPSVLRESGSRPGPKFEPTPPADGPSDERTVGVSWEELRAPGKKTPRGGSKWDRARRPAPRASRVDEAVPEVLATPESQMMPVPGAARSVMSERPDFASDASKGSAEVIALDDQRPKKSGGGAWGAPKAPSSAPNNRNVWGDASERALVPTEPPKKKNAWGDAKKPRAKRAGWGDDGRGTPKNPTPAPSMPSTPPPSQGGALQAQGGTTNRVELSSLAGSQEAALQLLTHPDGNYATQVRLLGARIEEFAKSLGYRAYMVSSPAPLTGKTTAACNLALALAEDTQRRIALVEANFRYPRFAEIFGFDERTGLLSVLEGRARLNEVGFKASDRNLLILPSGGRHTAPAEVLASPRFKALVSELADTVDLAIIDAPAITPFADANLIQPLVDAAFLVVAEGQTRRSLLSRAVDQLGEARILGSLFNRIPKKQRKELKHELKQRLSAKS